ncbi:MAG: KH domain-containing protein [Clostridia bacterium]|nr:KH domain-containing protein [Clostridia bacterium]
MYKDLLQFIVTRLVAFPERVVITNEDAKEENKELLKLKVAKEDMGRIIGKEGRIIRSIREILMSYGMKDGKKVSIEIEEEK